MDKVDMAIYKKLVYLLDFIETTERTQRPIDVNGIKLILKAHINDVRRKYKEATP